MAAEKGHNAIVSYLIEMGAEVDVRDSVGGYCLSNSMCYMELA
jgi:ankyrin repeat protein